MDLLFGDGAMLHAAWHDEELSRSERHAALFHLQDQNAFQYEKKLIFVLMVMPNELTLHFGQLHVLPVEFPHDVGMPVFVDLSELFLEVHGVFGHWCLLGGA
jgi:hypothetical protein